jgi:hypothetical protein
MKLEPEYGTVKPSKVARTCGTGGEGTARTVQYPRAPVPGREEGPAHVPAAIAVRCSHVLAALEDSRAHTDDLERTRRGDVRVSLRNTDTHVWLGVRVSACATQTHMFGWELEKIFSIL